MIGALIGQVARFYLFRKYVFRTPSTRIDLHHPVSLLGPAHVFHEPGPDAHAHRADDRV